MTHRRLMRLIDKKDKEFHEHIVKNRVDPTAQSATNPVPDYYGALWYTLARGFGVTLSRLPGEKIGSLHDYRQVSYHTARYRVGMRC